MAEKWVDHALSKSREVESKLSHSNKALAEVERKYKDSLFQLAEAERGRKNLKAAWRGFEKQANKLQVSLKKTKMQRTSAKEQIKLMQKDIEGKDA